MKYKAAIFDMDGTVLNTLDDLVTALNWALEQSGHRHDYQGNMVRQFFGSGVNVAIQRALAYEKGMPEEDLVRIGTPGFESVEGVSDQEVEEIATIYKPFYAEHANDKTGPYPGILDLLKALRAKKIPTAVVSNKPDEAVRILAEEVFAGLFDTCIGEQDGIPRKPARDMTDLVLKRLNVVPEEAVYIGDSEVDMQTAANGGMDCISVDWGFRSHSFLEERGAGPIVSDAAALEAEILRS